MIFRKCARRDRQREDRKRETRRRRLTRLMSRSPQVETLEARQLLAVIGVTTTNDVVDAGDGLVSLREAINTANANMQSDTINFTVPGTYAMSIAGTGEDLNVTGDYDIREDLTAAGAATTVSFMNTSGGEVIIDGLQKDRVFDVQPGQLTVNFNDITITGGDAGDGQGGGIRNRATTVVNRTIVRNNEATDGGGLANLFGTMTVNNSLITLNVAGIGNFGGGIYSEGDFQGPTLNVNDTTISNNQANADGGGLYIVNEVANIDGSTISGNRANDDGGGLFAAGFGSLINITNTTVSGNSAGDQGGGINFASIGGGPPATVSHVTITDNTARDAGGIRSDVGTTRLNNTLVAGNTVTTSNPDVSGAFASDGWNLIGINTVGGFGAVGDQLGTAVLPIDPLLGPLADNGGPVAGGIGPTRTHRLLGNSPAIDTGDPAPHAIHVGLTVDQRNRPRDARHDIGAYEVGPTIHGVKFIDDNWDGFRQDDEVGMEGLTIELKDATGAVVAITHTDKHGEYWFDLDHLGLPYPAQYEIGENLGDIWYLDEQTGPAPYYYGTDRIGGR